MKNLFILEDAPEAMPIIEWLKDKSGLNVVHAKNIEDAVYYLEYCDDKPIESYDYFLFDAAVPGATISLLNGETLRFLDNDGLNGVLLFERYRKKIEGCGAKVAFTTAYSHQLKCNEEIKNIEMIDKTAESFLKDLSKFLA